MRVRPMIFNTEMVKALIAGNKTVTRRPVKVDYERGMNGPVVRGKNGEVSVLGFATTARLCPFGNVGDLIYVRETFVPDPDVDHDSWDDHELSYVEWVGCEMSSQFLPDDLKVNEHCLYKADCKIDMKWTPSIHMPRWASRLTLKVTNVRIERLQEITEVQAIKEGLAQHQQFTEGPATWYSHDASHKSAVYAYEGLWNSIYGNWKQNPYVWVIEFEVIHQNVDDYLSSMES